MKLWALWLTCIIGFYSCASKAEVSELAMATDVGEVVLTVKDCDKENKRGFIYSAYATEKYDNTTGTARVHAGCWYKDHDIVNIWFYDESEPLVATYRDYHFKPR